MNSPGGNKFTSLTRVLGGARYLKIKYSDRCSLFNLNLKLLIAKNDFISDENEKKFSLNM